MWDLTRLGATLEIGETYKPAMLARTASAANLASCSFFLMSTHRDAMPPRSLNFARVTISANFVSGSLVLPYPSQVEAQRGRPK